MRKHTITLLLLTAALFFGFLSGGIAQNAVSPVSADGQKLTPALPRILLLVSYHTSNVGTSSFFLSLRTELKSLRLPVDRQIVELDAMQKYTDAHFEEVFHKYLPQIQSGVYSAVMTLNDPAAKVVMSHYDEIPENIPVIFAGLMNCPPDLKEKYPNSTAITAVPDPHGTIELGLSVFPDTSELTVVSDNTEMSARTRDLIQTIVKQDFPGLSLNWIQSNGSMAEMFRKLSTLPKESLVLLIPWHELFANHYETVTAFGYDLDVVMKRPYLVLDDSLIGYGALGGSLIQTSGIGTITARILARVLSAKSAKDIPVSIADTVRLIDYEEYAAGQIRSGRIPPNTILLNKPENIWERHGGMIAAAVIVILFILAIQSLHLHWTRKMLRLNRSMLNSLPGRVVVLNRAEKVLYFTEDPTNRTMSAEPIRTLQDIKEADYEKLSEMVNEVFQTGKQITFDYTYNSVQRAVSIAILNREIFNQDAVILFSHDNAELQNARNQAEHYAAQLKKNSRMWDILINSLPLHIFAKDAKNEFRYVFNNKARDEFYGKEAGGLDGKNDFDFQPIELAERMRVEDRTVIAHPEVLEEKFIDLKDSRGSARHLRTIQCAFLDDDGTQLVLGASMDITELENARIQTQRLNDRLQDLLEQHSILLDNIPSYVITKDIDNDFRFLVCNEACVELTGIPAHDLIGKNDFDIFHSQDDARKFRADDERAVSELEKHSEHFSSGTFIGRDGRMRYGKFYRKIIQSSDNRLLLFLLITDVTELEDAKRLAEENAEWFRLMLRSIGDGVLTTDINGNITMVNPVAERMIGCTQADALGKPHTDYFRIVSYPDDWPVPSPLTRSLRTGEVVNLANHTDLISMNGARYHIADSAAPIRNSGGQIIGAILVFRDVTDDYNKREQLRQAITGLENASEMASLASFRYVPSTHQRTGSSLLETIWPSGENGEPLMFDDWIHPEDLDVFRMKNQVFQDENNTNIVDFSFRSRPNEADKIRYFRAKVMADRSNPKEFALTGILQDVTAITLSTLRLKDTQELWKTTINAISVMFFVKDADRDFRYVLCNNAFAAFLGRTPDDVIGKTDAELFSLSSDAKQFREKDLAVMILPDGEEFNEESTDSKGKLHYVNTVKRAFTETNGRRLLLGVSNDITELHNLIISERINSDVLSKLTTEPLFDNVLNKIADTLKKEMNCDRIVVTKKNASGHMELYREWRFMDIPSIQNPLFSSQMEVWDHFLSAVQPGEAVRISDFAAFARENHLELDAVHPTQSLIAVPIYLSGAVWGMIAGSFSAARRDFSAIDANIMQSCANVISLAQVRELNARKVQMAFRENQLVLDNIDVPIWLYSTNAELVRANAAVRRMAGIPDGSLNTESDLRFFHDYAEFFDGNPLDIAMKTGASAQRRVKFFDRDFIVMVEPVRDDNGRPIYLLKYAVDVTELNLLIRNQKLINANLESIIGEDDTDKSLAGVLESICRDIHASRAFIMKYPENQATAECLAEFAMPEHVHPGLEFRGIVFQREEETIRLMKTQQVFVCNDVKRVQLKLANGNWRRLAAGLDIRAIIMAPLIVDGIVWGDVGFTFEAEDHTFSDNDTVLLQAMVRMVEVVLERKRGKEMILNALEKAQAADRAKSFFIASVSHEIRTPLNSVIGFAEILRGGNVAADVQKDYLDAISYSANALLLLINDVLDLSKLEANQMQIIASFTDFSLLCREVMMIFSFRAQENNNKLVLDAPPLPELEIDNIRVRQILLNLLGNAVKFTRDGTISLVVSFEPVSDSEGTLHIAVKDTGIGISADDQKKLMEPFVQLSKLRGTNAANNGTGLGLSISKRLAIRMNGSLTCESELGKGSTFRVTLNGLHYRASKSTAEQTPSGQALPASGIAESHLSILLVDDVKMNLKVAKALCLKVGIQNVLTAVSGQDAVAILEKQHVDLILTDMWMPGMNGAQLAELLKSRPSFCSIPVVALTADVETRGNFDMKNFSAILLKPVTIDKLTAMINHLIGSGMLSRNSNKGADCKMMPELRGGVTY